MSNKIFEIVNKEGKHFHKYEFWNRNTLTWATYTGESIEQICQAYKFNKEDFRIRQVSFSMWDYDGWATPVEEPTNASNP